MKPSSWFILWQQKVVKKISRKKELFHKVNQFYFGVWKTFYHYTVYQELKARNSLHFCLPKKTFQAQFETIAMHNLI